MPIKDKYAGDEYIVAQMYYNGQAANSEGLYPHTFLVSTGTYINNAPGVSTTHTRIRIPCSDYIDQVKDLETDIMP